MPTCPVCGFDNTPNALICTNCSAPLSLRAAEPEMTIEISEKIVADRRHAPRPTGVLSGTGIALFVEDAQEPVIVDVVRQAVLGRYVANSRSQPRVDLTPYAAYEKGVSRLHAIIRRTENGLTIEDLASTNGTLLNGVALDPYIPRPLASGDHLKLARLEIEIRFDSKQS